MGIVDYLLQLRDILSHHSLFTVGILLLLGYAIGKLAGKVKLPEITGFIVAGLLVGESVTGIVPHHMGESLKVVTEVALGLIALTIGGEFAWAKLKRMGKGVIIITLAQLFLSFAAVSVALIFFKVQLPFALLLGAIASATAPAATVAIVQSLRARGKFVDYLYGVVALDDAGAVILFGVIFAIASGLLGVAGEAVHTGTVILHAILEVVYSLVIGAVSGFIIHILSSRKNSQNEIMLITLGILFLTTALSIVFHLSPLLTNMAAGAVIINLSPRNHRIFRILEPLTPPIYALFFVIAGTELQPAAFMRREILITGTVYIVFRAAGKYLGVYLGGMLSGTQRLIKKYLGFCMFPQAGVAIGLVLLIQASPITASLAPEYVRIIDTMVNIILFSVFVNELIGPPISRYALIKGNEMEE